jgi:hypothetical protein
MFHISLKLLQTGLIGRFFYAIKVGNRHDFLKKLNNKLVTQQM